MEACANSSRTSTSKVPASPAGMGKRREVVERIVTGRTSVPSMKTRTPVR